MEIKIFWYKYLVKVFGYKVKSTQETSYVI